MLGVHLLLGPLLCSFDQKQDRYLAVLVKRLIFQLIMLCLLSFEELKVWFPCHLTLVRRLDEFVVLWW